MRVAKRSRVSRSARGGGMVLVAAVLAAAGCQGPSLTPPEALVAPYSTAQGTPVWAVAPLANESGTSVADAGMVSDALVAKLAEVRGLSALPLNRTLGAMRALRLDAIRSPAEARALAEALGVDGLVIGTITAYDPYEPPRLGLTLGLFTRDGRGGPQVDPESLRTAASERAVTAPGADAQTVVSDYADAANHEVLMDLRRYAEGRHDPNSALGWRRYTASMELFTEFAAHRAVSRLLEQERLRLARSRGPVGASRPAAGPR